ncbi:MAG: glycerophosphodiester phosphodiesterase [Cyclobacteriaceae bacterium]|nr:glycerophosphodiester phosphodiesterase [Cyclobacteriaceae bacterium HetDA_MAG_MS6]
MLDIQGHRGARGLLPENTIPAFLKAVDLGVTTLELDLCVTRDSQLVVSHEPYFNADICLDYQGRLIKESEKKLLNIYQMTYDQVKAFDCGSLGNPRFPQQKTMRVSKPLFSDVITAIEDHCDKHGKPAPNFNIELKSDPKGDSLYQPVPSDFSDLVYRFVDNRLAWDRITIQSFDFRILRYFHQSYPNVKLAVLIENELPWEENLQVLGFEPSIYSCYYKLLSEQKVKQLQSRGIAVIPWTVNNATDMEQLVSWGADGIITDYPNIALELFR